VEQQNVHCPRCRGTGKLFVPEYEDGYYVVCLVCEGRGFVSEDVAKPILAQIERDAEKQNVAVREAGKRLDEHYRVLNRKIYTGVIIAVAIIVLMIFACVTTGHC